ncbi:hypothetical protein B0J14DRAFT_182195 [Halenospora varia]|nr:hypothetical protein B0J14DRAFT_182195 [Halenospora varia]
MGQIHAQENEKPRMTCLKCHFVTCSRHQCPWNEGDGHYDHNSRTCKGMPLSDDASGTLKREILPDSDIFFARKIKRSTSSCPNCEAKIKNVEGTCDDMRCKCASPKPP